MLLQTEEQCHAYVEVELGRLIQSRPDWHSGRTVNVPLRPLSWNVGCDATEYFSSWYTIEADLQRSEFLIWFGNSETGAENVLWIMRPAVHIAFADLGPRDGYHSQQSFGLSDILDIMICTLEFPSSGVLRFGMNTYSLT